MTDPAEAERQSNARQSLDALRNVADWFSTVRGRRKAILFVSEGIDYDITDFANTGASLIMDATRETLAAAARGNVSIYGIDPRGLTNLADETIEVGSFPDDTSLGTRRSIASSSELRLSQNSLRELSDETGGFAVVNANDFATAFDRIVRDNSSYYAMAYYPPSDKAGKFHKIEVRVRRPGLRVRARQGYVTPKPAARPARNARAAAAGRDADDAGDSRGARQPAAGQRPDHEGVCGAVQGHGAERVGAARRRAARPRSASRPERQGRRDVRRGRREGKDSRRQHRRR